MELLILLIYITILIVIAIMFPPIIILYVWVAIFNKIRR